MAQNQQQNKTTADDYCSYVTKMARKTSMCEGPYFPSLFKMFRVNKDQTSGPRKASGTGQGKVSTSSNAGRFGRAEHVEYEICSETNSDEVLEVKTGEYVRKRLDIQ